MNDVDMAIERIKKLKELLEKLTDLYYDSQKIIGTDDNAISRAISYAEDELIRDIDWEKSNLKESEDGV
jgi:hypothetical protein